jgi:serine protease AprX
MRQGSSLRLISLLLFLSGPAAAVDNPSFLVRFHDQPAFRQFPPPVDPSAAARRAFRERMEAAAAPSRAWLERAVSGMHGRVVKWFTIVNAAIVELPPDAASLLTDFPDLVEGVYPMAQVVATGSASGSYWQSDVTGATSLYARGIDGRGVTIAVLDTGLTPDANDPDFDTSGRSVLVGTFLTLGAGDPCFSSKESANSPNDIVGHGTTMSRLAAGTISGIAPRANLLALKTNYLNGCDTLRGGHGEPGDILSALEWAVLDSGQGVQVINLSSASRILAQYPDDYMSRIFDEIAATYDITILVSTGNEGPAFEVDSPGNALNVVTVGAWGSLSSSPDRATHYTVGISNAGLSVPAPSGPVSDTLLRFKPDIVAPGYQVPYSGRSVLDYILDKGESGSSPATAVASGAAALVHQLLNESAATLPPGTRSIAAKALLINGSNTNRQLPTALWNLHSGWGYLDVSDLAAGFSVFGGSTATPYTDYTSDPSAYRIYAGSAPRGANPFKATLVWQKPAVGAFPNFDLYLYEAKGGEQLARSESQIQNVEQVGAEITGDVLLKVVQREQAVSSAQFALAIQGAGFQELAPPHLSLSCSADSASGNFNLPVLVDCSVSHDSSRALTVGVFLTRPIDFSFSSVGESGYATVLAPGARASVRFVVIPQNTCTSCRVNIQAGVSLAGESFSASQDLAVSYSDNFSGSAKAYVATPLPDHFATDVPIGPATLYWTVGRSSIPPSTVRQFKVYFGPDSSPPLLATIAVTSSPAGPVKSPPLQPNQSYYWRVDLDTTDNSTITGPLWTFRTATGAAPAAPVLLGPVADAKGVARLPVFTWTDVPGAMGYTVLVWKDGVSTNSSPLVTATASSLSSVPYGTLFFPLDPGQRYRWAAEAEFPGGTKLRSDTQAFTTTCFDQLFAAPGGGLGFFPSSSWDRATDRRMPYLAFTASDVTERSPFGNQPVLFPSPPACPVSDNSFSTPVWLHPVAAGITFTADDYTGLTDLDTRYGVLRIFDELSIPVSQTPQFSGVLCTVSFAFTAYQDAILTPRAGERRFMTANVSDPSCELEAATTDQDWIVPGPFSQNSGGKSWTGSLQFKENTTGNVRTGVLRLKIKQSAVDQLLLPAQPVAVPVQQAAADGCEPLIYPSVLSFGHHGGQASSLVLLGFCPASLSIAADPTQDWLTLAGPLLATSGSITRTLTVQVSVAPNPTGQAREGIIRVEGFAIRVRQAAKPTAP